MNIIFKRPDGGVTVVHLTPDAVSRMEEANSFADIVPKKEALEMRVAEIHSQKESFEAQAAEIRSHIGALMVEMLILETQSPTEFFETRVAEIHSQKKSFEAQAAEIRSHIGALMVEMSKCQAVLDKILFYETVKVQEGLSLKEHAAILQSPHTEPDGSITYRVDPSFQFVAENITMPATKEFREAWTWTTPEPVVDIDFEKAREITKQRLRKERAPLLQSQDVAFQRALEMGGDTAAIVVEKQRLRDITILADAAADLTALKALRV